MDRRTIGSLTLTNARLQTRGRGGAAETSGTQIASFTRESVFPKSDQATDSSRIFDDDSDIEPMNYHSSSPSSPAKSIDKNGHLTWVLF